MPIRSLRTAAIAAALAVCLTATTALADLWGADLGPLSALVTQAAAQLTQLAQTLSTLRPTYEETKRIGALETVAMDHEAAVGMASSSAQLGRDELARARARAPEFVPARLMKLGLSGSATGGPADRRAA
ncbi:MAG: hypothetical protein ACYC8T_15680 [Myxococcaceae bacterium]